MIGREVESSSKALYGQLCVAFDAPKVADLIKDSERFRILCEERTKSSHTYTHSHTHTHSLTHSHTHTHTHTHTLTHLMVSSA